LHRGEADTGINLRIQRSQLEQIIINRGLLDARLANNRADIARLHFEAAQTTLDVRGGAGLNPNSLANISYRVHSPNIRELLLLAKMKGTGALGVNGTVGGPRSALRTRGTVELNSIQAAGYSVRQGTTRYNLAVTGPEAPFGQLNAALNGVKAGAELRSIALALDAAP